MVRVLRSGVGVQSYDTEKEGREEGAGWRIYGARYSWESAVCWVVEFGAG